MLVGDAVADHHATEDEEDRIGDELEGLPHDVHRVLRSGGYVHTTDGGLHGKSEGRVGRGGCMDHLI